MTGRLQHVLTREELDAFLADSQAPRSDDGEALFAPAEDGTQTRGPLVRALADFGEEISRRLSTEHQRPIRFTPIGNRLVTASELIASTISMDEVVALDTVPADGRVHLLIGRSLFFGWFGMALGARARIGNEVPDRANTKIERRFLKHFGRELVAPLQRALSPVRDVRLECGEVLDPADLPGLIEKRVCEASFSVDGFSEVAQLRIALPVSWIDDAAVAKEAGDTDGSSMEARVRDVPLELRAEIGNAELSLSKLAALREGDTLLLDPVADGRVLVRLENTARFVAVPGVVGNRLAIQLVDEVQA